jgi:hypothetical protein
MRKQRTTAAGKATPGRPKESGSRQQTQHDQASHSGSPKTDRLIARRAQVSSRSKPASAK